MPIADPVIYLKKSLKSIWKYPKPGNLISYIRLYPDWKEHLKPGRNSVDDRMPWISFDAIDYLKKIARPNMRVFEYGSGGSTMFWISRVQELISVEHDLSWYSRMKSILDRQTSGNFKFILAEPTSDIGFEEKKFENPSDFISGDDSYKGKSFENYARVIDQFPDNYFDIIIVDGRARPSCIQQGIPKLK